MRSGRQGTVRDFAQEHGKSALLERANAEIETSVQTQTSLLQSKDIAATLRYRNDPDCLSRDNSFYRQMLRVGAGSQQGNLAAVMTTMGHKDVKTAMQYQHPELEIIAS
jgi:hypothetical protein